MLPSAGLIIKNSVWLLRWTVLSCSFFVLFICKFIFIFSHTCTRIELHIFIGSGAGIKVCPMFSTHSSLQKKTHKTANANWLYKGKMACIIFFYKQEILPLKLVKLYWIKKMANQNKNKAIKWIAQNEICQPTSIPIHLSFV